MIMELSGTRYVHLLGFISFRSQAQLVWLKSLNFTKFQSLIWTTTKEKITYKINRLLCLKSI